MTTIYKKRLSRRPVQTDDERDREWVDRLAKQAQTDAEMREIALEMWLRVAERRARQYSELAMRRGVRIYPDEFYERFAAAVYRALDTYDGESAGFETYFWRVMRNAAADVWRRANKRADAHNRTALSLDLLAERVADPAAVNPEAAAISVEMWRQIDGAGAVPADVKRAARMIADGATLQDIADALGYEHKQIVLRRLALLRDVCAEWR